MKLKKAKKQLSRFFINVGTSGKYWKARAFGRSDYLIRYYLLNFIIIFGMLILTAFIADTIKGGRYASTVAVSVMDLVCAITFFLARANIPQIVPSTLLMIFYGLMCVVITSTGGAHGANFLFIYTYPPLTIMLLGMRLGVAFSSILIALIFAEMFIPDLIPFEYHFDITIRMLVGYILVFSVMIVIETTRRRKDRLIDAQNKILHQLRDEAMAANRTKSNFLASMSHEIRTPMNAITGMAELLLRGNISDETRGYAKDIKHAGQNLVSIINDILDFSKIEAGKLEIIPVNYFLSSVINDTANIIRMRIMDKPIKFSTNIGENIPDSLIGDEVRLRQILMNLLSNAVKYSEKGQINLSITADKKIDKQVWLKIVVSDTGFGIKPEDLEKLFSDFVQIDTKKNRSIEGTGLGLAITRRLCRAMDGKISVKSEYGKGSEFTAIIPQGIKAETPYASSLLNSNADSFNIASSHSAAIRFAFPKARILIVDDIATNLKVAEGLLAPYKAAIDTSLSGAKAIELVKANEYDIIFMDHMMPEMDGVETTVAIRALKGERFKTTPIVALTANAISGMREMFLEKGFSDFLAKPIDISKMDEVLGNWIAKEKREQNKENKMEQKTDESEMPSIPGVDIKHGLAMTGGTMSLYRQVLALFRKDAEDRLPMLQKEPTEDNLPAFVTQVHALKSASASLGAAGVSEMAKSLEMAGKAKDMDFIHQNLSGFAKQLAELAEGIKAWEAAAEKNNPSGGGDSAAAAPLLRELAAALEAEKADDIDRILEELNEMPLDAKTKEALEKISDDVLMTEFASANETVRRLLK